MNEKSLLMQVHRQLVKSGLYFLAQVLFQHLSGVKENKEVAQFILSIYQ